MKLTYRLHDIFLRRKKNYAICPTALFAVGRISVDASTTNIHSEKKLHWIQTLDDHIGVIQSNYINLAIVIIASLGGIAILFANGLLPSQFELMYLLLIFPYSILIMGYVKLWENAEYLCELMDDFFQREDDYNIDYSLIVNWSGQGGPKSLLNQFKLFFTSNVINMLLSIIYIISFLYVADFVVTSIRYIICDICLLTR